jgi:hypothetical protein
METFPDDLFQPNMRLELKNTLKRLNMLSDRDLPFEKWEGCVKLFLDHFIEDCSRWLDNELFIKEKDITWTYYLEGEFMIIKKWYLNR